MTYALSLLIFEYDQIVESSFSFVLYLLVKFNNYNYIIIQMCKWFWWHSKVENLVTLALKGFIHFPPPPHAVMGDESVLATVSIEDSIILHCIVRLWIVLLITHTLPLSTRATTIMFVFIFLRNVSRKFCIFTICDKKAFYEIINFWK